jgi:hypothetical protein
MLLDGPVFEEEPLRVFFKFLLFPLDFIIKSCKHIAFRKMDRNYSFIADSR